MTRRILLAGTAAVAACAAIYLYGLIRWDRQVVAEFETGASR